MSAASRATSLARLTGMPRSPASAAGSLMPRPQNATRIVARRPAVCSFLDRTGKMPVPYQIEVFSRTPLLLRQHFAKTFFRRDQTLLRDARRRQSIVAGEEINLQSLLLSCFDDCLAFAFSASRTRTGRAAFCQMPARQSSAPCPDHFGDEFFARCQVHIAFTQPFKEPRRRVES